MEEGMNWAASLLIYPVFFGGSVGICRKLGNSFSGANDGDFGK